VEGAAPDLARDAGLDREQRDLQRVLGHPAHLGELQHDEHHAGARVATACASGPLAAEAASVAIA
jgi:hypothetical protein